MDIKILLSQFDTMHPEKIPNLLEDDKILNTNNFFENVMFSKEEDIVNKLPQNGCKIIDSSGNKRHCGIFISPTLDEIIHFIENSEISRGSLSYEIKSGINVVDLHLNAEDGEIIQGASQFNALEMMSPYAKPKDGVSIYIQDVTQGPRLSMMALPAVIYRNYHFIKENKKQFNALELLNLEHKNGYLLWNDNPEKIEENIKENYRKIKIPSMCFTQVDGIDYDYHHVTYHNRDKLIHQIFSSSAPFDAYGNGGNKDSQLNIIKYILKAQYMGVIGTGLILNSLKKKNRPIHLTLVGGGVFNNPLEIIHSAIHEAMDFYSKYKCKIIIHCFKYSEYKDFLNLEYNSLSQSFDSLSLDDVGDIEKWLLSVPKGGDTHFYNLRRYQLEMLKFGINLREKESKNYKSTDDDGYHIIATIYKENGKVSFVGTDMQKKYFIPKKSSDYNFTQKDSEFFLHNKKSGESITKWPHHQF